jgi:hypothetical protein
MEYVTILLEPAATAIDVMHFSQWSFFSIKYLYIGVSFIY